MPVQRQLSRIIISEINDQQVVYLKEVEGNRTFPILEKKFYCKGGRQSVGQEFEGYGMKVFPDTKSEKPR